MAGKRRLLTLMTALVAGFSLKMYAAEGQVLDIKAFYTCFRLASGDLEMEFAGYSGFGAGSVDRMRAIDSSGAEIPDCPVSGSGSDTDPFQTRVVVDLDGEVAAEAGQSQCGAVYTPLTGNRKRVTWRFKFYPSGLVGEFGDFGDIHRAFCSSDDLTSTSVNTRVALRLNRFRVSARNPDDEPIPGQIIPGKRIKYQVIVYPDDERLTSELFGRPGYFVHSCQSSTNELFTENVETIVTDAGCRNPDATFGPSTDFTVVSSDTTAVILEADGPPATTVGDDSHIYFRCRLGYWDACTTQSCEQRCAATDPGTSTQETLLTSIQVQDFVAIELDLVSGEEETPVNVVYVGNQYTIRVRAYPFAANAANFPNLPNAQGIYVGECVRDFQSTFSDQPNPVTDDTGCRALTGDTVIDDDFTSSALGNTLYSRSGSLRIQNTEELRVYLQCQVFACPDSNDPACDRKCGTSGTGNARRIGAVTTSYLVISVQDDPSIALRITDPTGNLPTGQVIRGSTIPFRASILTNVANAPASLRDAQGAYLQDCYYYGDIPQPRQFIDTEGCVVDRFLSQECVLVVADPPYFEIDCGDFVVLGSGDTMNFTCGMGVCDGPNDSTCENRCGKGPISGNPNARDIDNNVSAGLTLVDDLGRKRTAEVSEPLRVGLAIGSALGGLVFALIVMIVAYLVLRRQRRKLIDDEARSYRSTRYYNN